MTASRGGRPRPAPRNAGGERHWAESVARAYLEGRGLRHLASNYALRVTELDLVMWDSGTLVVVEVKQRRSARYGHPGEAIDARKAARLLFGARRYAAVELGAPEVPLRLDAVLVLGERGEHRVEHLENVGWQA